MIASHARTPTIIPFRHNLQAGDHVFRWSSILLYPIQIHGIVLSTSEGVVTIVDFGLSALIPQSKNESELGSTIDALEEECRHKNLDDAVSSKDIDMEDRERRRRFRIIVLTDDVDFKRWKRVDYGEERIHVEEASMDVNKKSWWNWFSSKPDASHVKPMSEDRGEPSDLTEGQQDTLPSSSSSSLSCGIESNSVDTSKENETNVAQHTNQTINNDEKSIDSVLTQDLCTSKDRSTKNVCKDQPAKIQRSNKSSSSSSSSPNSDPTFLILARVRYLMLHPDILPPHHLIYSNSECMAVWCKTGRWSTFQASFFLQSTAAGQIKSAATLAAYVGSQTVTMTVPAGGIMGWFGATTTTSVSLISVQPWLVPALAGYGIVAVGAPMILLLRARGKWEKTTFALTDGFWSWVDNDIVVQLLSS